MDGATTNDSGSCGLSAPAAWAKAHKEGPERPPNARKVGEVDESEEHNFIW
jgi:hypothetical protein